MDVAVGELDNMPKISIIEGKGVVERGAWADQVDSGVLIVAGASCPHGVSRGHRLLGLWSSEGSTGLVRDVEAFNGCS